MLRQTWLLSSWALQSIPGRPGRYPHHGSRHGRRRWRAGRIAVLGRRPAWLGDGGCASGSCCGLEPRRSKSRCERHFPRRAWENQVGDRLRIRGESWLIVGAFEDASRHFDQDLIADAETLLGALGRTSFEQIVVVMSSPAAFDKFRESVASDPALRQMFTPRPRPARRVWRSCADSWTSSATSLERYWRRRPFVPRQAVCTRQSMHGGASSRRSGESDSAACRWSHRFSRKGWCCLCVPRQRALAISLIAGAIPGIRASRISVAAAMRPG